MNAEQIYFEEQEFNCFQSLIYGKEILNDEEKNFCEKWDKEECDRVLNDIGGGRWLNINVYCEASHHAAVERMERGY